MLSRMTHRCWSCPGRNRPDCGRAELRRSWRSSGQCVAPRIEGAIAPELRQRPVGLDEGVLCDVFGFCRIAYITHDQLDYFVLVLEDQHIKCPSVPVLHTLDQTQVACVGSHSLHFTLAYGTDCLGVPG